MSDRTWTVKGIAQELQQVTADLHQVNLKAGLVRFTILGLIFLSLVTLAWSVANNVLFVAVTMLAGVFYSFWLICTHDMAHQTLTGWKWFDSIMPRLIGWPMLWPYSIYAEIHRLHHAWNGIDLRDPERVQWTWQEYEQAMPIVRWYISHQWLCDIFIFGGVGLILKTFIKGVSFQNVVAGMRRQIILDVTGIIFVHSFFLMLAIFQGEILRYILFWLILERIIGMITQTRDHLEHYALWGKFTSHQLTQLYACRNIQTSSVVSWLMGGLDYHAVHHTFSDIPFNQLPTAFKQIQSVLKKYNLPLMERESGYLKSAYCLSRNPSLIKDGDGSITPNRHRMIPVSK
ncbi:fatty acid desaturase [Nostocaceae cyanobacterium CENA369]|uniref:Fatty acid desaturase n=1 Tax=Dendronalium phyllosphericum CENA369 TaxID=1725256 RepID=A0A8J7LGK4_9NOST|nr:fatty acid desaturase [Dendronalium phyllosphericum]MBH8573069.1 fatty acid desaturase [Dendronalium phyllosphericum CENA369]